MSRVETKRKISNVKIHVKLSNKGETVLDTTRRGKTRLLKILQGSLDGIWDAGYIKVTYNNKQDYYNHAEFQDLEKLDTLLTDFLDPYLVKEYA